MSYTWFVVAVTLVSIAAPVIGASQSQSEALRGTVKDQTGGVISGAQVTLAGAGGRTHTTLTDGEGGFRIDGIVPGSYGLTITHNFFAPFVMPLDFGSGPVPPLDITLYVVISLHEAVTADIGISPGRNLSSMVLRSEDIAALPSDARLFWQRLAEMAGSTGRPGDMTLYIDGFRRSVRLPPRETIEMIRIDANPFAAEFQEPGRGRVEIITKPGSDRLLSQVALNFSDETLNARNAFATTRPSEQYRRYSGYIGGPLVPGRWGFLVYAGRWEQDENAVVYATTVERHTLQPAAFALTVPTPLRTTSFAIKGHSFAGAGNIATMMYSREHQTSDNRGVGGYSLPEHAYDVTTAEDVGQLSIVSISTRRLNDFRMDLTRQVALNRSRLGAPEVIVFDAFTAGGNQHALFNRSVNYSLMMSEAVTYAVNRHTIKAGGSIVAQRLRDTNRANFGGQFLFGGDVQRDAFGLPTVDGHGQTIPISPIENYRRTLAGLPGHGPSQFVVNRGEPEARLGDARLAWFVQDDWQVRPGLTMSYGLRHDVQTQIDYGFTLGPRAGLAWSPDRAGSSVVRAGLGLFYNHVATGPLLDTIRFDGRRQQQTVVPRPAFFPDIPPVLTGGEEPRGATSVRAAELRMSRLAVTSVAYERQLPASAYVSSGYTWRRGFDLLRSRNINAPRPGGGSLAFPDRGPVVQLESTGSGSRHELDVRWRQNVGAALTTYATYILGSSRSDTDGPTTLPANSYDLTTEFGRAAGDVRHQLMTGSTVPLPRGWAVSLYVTASSAPPLNITTGRDNNGDTSFTDRPSWAVAGDPDAVPTPFGLLDPDPSTARIIPRNLGRQAGRVEVSVSAIKAFGQGLTINVDVSNLLNQTHATAFNGVLGAPDFGQPTQARPARRIELGVSKRF